MSDQNTRHDKFQDLITDLSETIVDRWDYDTIIEFAVQKLYESYFTDASMNHIDEELVLGDLDNVFQDCVEECAMLRSNGFTDEEILELNYTEEDLKDLKEIKSPTN